MTNNSYPRLRKLYSKSDIPEDPSKFLRESEESKIAKHVWEYYDKKDSMKPIKYEVTTGEGNVHQVNSNLAVAKPRFPSINNIEGERRYFSEYEERILDTLGLNKDKHWNGDLADLSYENGNVHLGKTDYYSTAPIVRMLSAEINNEGENPLRDYFLKDIDDFKNPLRPVSATSGGVMIANRGDDKWVMLIGKRSDQTHMNSGMFSIFPNGKCEYLDLKNGGFEETVKREFTEEIFSNQKKGDMFYDKHIESEQVVSGWNLRTGSFTVGYSLMMNTRLSYDVLNELSQHNDEIEDIIEIPIQDISMIIEKANLESMSGSVIPVIFETLRKMNQSEKYPNMSYQITRQLDS